MANKVDSSRFFIRRELACKHTGRCEMDREFMEKLDALRAAMGMPLVLSSAFRDPSHPAEVEKLTTGYHPQGRAVDVSISGSAAHRLVGLAVMAGFGGIGISQKGAGRFIHLDNRETPTIWSY